MVRVIEYDKLYRINTYGRRFIIEVDASYSEKVKEIAGQLDLTCSGYKRNLLVYLAELTLQGFDGPAEQARKSGEQQSRPEKKTSVFLQHKKSTSRNFMREVPEYSVFCLCVRIPENDGIRRDGGLQINNALVAGALEAQG